MQVLEGTGGISTTVNSGGVVFVRDFATGKNTTASTRRSREFVLSSGTASGTTVSTGGYLVVLPGGTERPRHQQLVC